MKVNCEHYLTAKKIYAVDPKTKQIEKDMYWWWADCELFGNEEEIGFDCGKGRCSHYTPIKKEVKHD
jgi:hypothetical protein